MQGPISTLPAISARDQQVYFSPFVENIDVFGKKKDNIHVSSTE